MTRKTDRLEALASDLASRYGESDPLVQSVREAIPKRRAAVPAGPRINNAERRFHKQGPMARSKQSDAHV
ncbi:hypothetical protein [Rhodoferax lacus]|uniref:hypothetical protein n=1 Tax=Rhodoferax lacus TaxID=2184758 RepID=UPI000E3DD732|nr:hypothetical protein [Rhodoferax lacus]